MVQGSSGQESGAKVPRRRRRSSEEVADRILEAAAEEFEQSGYTGATTAAIARRAEVTEAQIFRFHASKQDLFRAAIFTPLNRHFADFQARSVADLGSGRESKELAREYIRELQDFMARHSRMFMSLIVATAYSPDATGAISELDGLQAYFEKGKALMSARVGAEAPVSPELMVRVSFAAVLANLMFRDWLFPPGLASDEEIRDAIATFVIEGIEANGPVGEGRG
ncbi:TetR/AcrR family transcriptional regulator [Novosphingobium mangrovi (ex Huang et al. 2023)]|uniref:TetR/AcrR family transcriptional regulator n=1 Tax=Novosphingobium mangrovi (ex Huang et al. 2023) TaxID=2976432 RepID=A0ABT2IA32_9SPHN|nr:TetR/AcrR family transcriptional regulator [Novosphingobium mangrovi (ex Huang et al. 2023)]MCT2401685.1 TetR/AcrR family transcriptional regulator [Novosphingobium mangrovi (ex Huang et al. 2023)]